MGKGERSPPGARRGAAASGLGADLDGMALFVRIVQHGGLSAAGRAMGLPKATVSRRLSVLEARLGIPLLRRNSRGLSLTDAGRGYFDRCRPIVAEAEAAEAELRERTAGPSGLLRLTASVAFGGVLLLPVLDGFLRRNPDVRMELDLTDRWVKVIEDGYDLAIRVGRLDDSELLSRRLATLERRLVASPAYAARGGVPASLADLAGHEALAVAPGLRRWSFATPEGGQEVIAVAGRLTVSSMVALREAALLGTGVALLPAFLVDGDLEAGRLLRLLPKWRPTPTEATALYPRAKAQPAALRRLLDALAAAAKEGCFAPRRPGR